MTLLTFFLKFKSNWLAKQEAKLNEEYSPQLSSLRDKYQSQLDEIQSQSDSLTKKYQELKHLEAQVLDQESILSDKKINLERANEELRTQLRLIEAKASPDSVWVEAFSRGYEKAWDTMQPIWQRGLEVAVEKAKTSAIDETLRNLNPVRPIHELLVKQNDLEKKRDQAKEPVIRQKYDNYLEALSWALDGHSIR